MRDLEKEIEKEKSEATKLILKDLANFPRLMIREDIANPYKLMGTRMVASIIETLGTISLMRDKKDHTILQNLEILLTESIKDQLPTYHDLCLAETWTENITNILFGEFDEKTKKRNTEEYKNTISSKEVEEKLFQYILQTNRTAKTKKSIFLQDFSKHCRKTLDLFGNKGIGFKK